MTDSDNDTMWREIQREAQQDALEEPALASFLYSVILHHPTLEDALSFHLASKLGSSTVPELTLRDLICEAFAGDPQIGEAIRADINAVFTRDPACTKYSIPFLFFKGFHAIQSYRAANYYWERDRKPLALYLQSRIAETFAVDIHPAASIGRGLLFDHATGIVIGETAVVEDDVSMLHEVTLGGTGKETGDRHPKVRRGVLIGAGAKILGNVEIGQGAKIGAGSVVLTPIPPHCTAVGVPARVVGHPRSDEPALSMDHEISGEENE